MPKRVMSLSVPIMIGSCAFFAALLGQFERSAFAGGAGGAGGGTRLYGINHTDVQITTDPVSGVLLAYGSLGTTRAETFPPAVPQDKEIGCWIDAGYAGASFTCQAITSAGQILQCTSALNAPPSLAGSVPWGGGFAQGIATINDDSFIEFITDMFPGRPSVGGECIGLHIDNSSKYYPRVP
jgi:hypothetical protein